MPRELIEAGKIPLRDQSHGKRDLGATGVESDSKTVGGRRLPSGPHLSATLNTGPSCQSEGMRGKGGSGARGLGLVLGRGEGERRRGCAGPRRGRPGL